MEKDTVESEPLSAAKNMDICFSDFMLTLFLKLFAEKYRSFTT